MAGTHRPPTLGEGVREAKEKEESRMGGRQEVGARSWEAGAQRGRPGPGAVGTGEVPHNAFGFLQVEGQDTAGNTRGSWDWNPRDGIIHGQGKDKCRKYRAEEACITQGSQRPINMMPSCYSRRFAPV